VFDVGLGEIALLLFAALFIFGPDRLPQVVQQGSRLLRQLREMAAGARSELSDALGPELTDLDIVKSLGLHELDPRSTIQRFVAEVDPTRPDGGAGNGSAVGPAQTNGSRAAAAETGSATAATGPALPSFDPDAT